MSVCCWCQCVLLVSVRCWCQCAVSVSVLLMSVCCWYQCAAGVSVLLVSVCAAGVSGCDTAQAKAEKSQVKLWLRARRHNCRQQTGRLKLYSDFLQHPGSKNIGRSTPPSDSWPISFRTVRRLTSTPASLRLVPVSVSGPSLHRWQTVKDRKQSDRTEAAAFFHSR